MNPMNRTKDVTRVLARELSRVGQSTALPTRTEYDSIKCGRRQVKVERGIASAWGLPVSEVLRHMKHAAFPFEEWTYIAPNCMRLVVRR